MNADNKTVTAHGFLGCNMYSYSLGNPINMVDTCGKDAIWIQESGSAGGMGHSGLMVQDSEGKWQYFYWGPNSEKVDPKLIVGVKHGAYIEEIDTYDADMTDTDVVKAVLKQASGNAKDRADKVTQTFYFEGDYTATYIKAKAIVDGTDQYKLVSNNCVQKTIESFSASDKRFLHVGMGYGSIIPNKAATRVSLIPSKKEKTPWLLYMYNLLSKT